MIKPAQASIIPLSVGFSRNVLVLTEATARTMDIEMRLRKTKKEKVETISSRGTARGSPRKDILYQSRLTLPCRGPLNSMRG